MLTVATPTSFGWDNLMRGEIELSWDGSAYTAGESICVEQSTNGGSTYSEVERVSAAAGQTVVEDHWAGTYYYRIRAVDIDSAEYSSYAGPLNFTLSAGDVALPTPSIQSLFNRYRGDARLTWDEDLYRSGETMHVELSTNGTSFNEVGGTHATLGMWDPSGLTAGTYYYRIRAATDASQRYSAYSDTAGITLSSTDVGPPPPGSPTWKWDVTWPYLLFAWEGAFITNESVNVDCYDNANQQWIQLGSASASSLSQYIDSQEVVQFTFRIRSYNSDLDRYSDFVDVAFTT